MGFIKKTMYGAIAGGLLGALAGSQYGSVREAYQEVLETQKEGAKIEMDYVKKHKKDFDKDTYHTRLEEVQRAYQEADDELESYKEMEGGAQKKKALTDVGNYGMTIKEFELGLNPFRN